MLNNFLTNAIKYASSGSAITIQEQKANGHITVAVSGKGPGINEVYLSGISEGYFQVPGRSEKKAQELILLFAKNLLKQ